MSRRRRNSMNNDSLDMLLDTITNTFGGILLVALLLVLLIRNTTAQQADVADEERVTVAEQQKLQVEMERLQERRETLRQSTQMLQDLEANFAEPGKQQLAEELGKLLGEVNALQEQKQQLEAAAAALKSQAAKLESDKLAGQQDAVGLQAALASAELDLKNELALRTRTMDLPREQYTNKALTAVFLLKGKLYFPDRGTGRAGFQINLDQFESCEETAANLVLSSGEAYRVKPAAGVAIERSVIQRNLAKLPATDFYLTIICDRESFETFRGFKDVLVELGYEHRIMPVAEPRVFETTSSDRAKVQ
ncbi:MAG: hypothetical protein ACK56J_17005 [Planctomycetota bacterium]